MNINYNKTFPVQVWGLSILIGSVVFALILLSNFIIDGPDEVFKTVMILALMACTLSWPSFIATYFLIKKLVKKGESVKTVKAWGYCISVTGLSLTFLFFEPGLFEDKIILTGLICYIAAITFSYFIVSLSNRP